MLPGVSLAFIAALTQEILSPVEFVLTVAFALNSSQATSCSNVSDAVHVPTMVPLGHTRGWKVL